MTNSLSLGRPSGLSDRDTDRLAASMTSAEAARFMLAAHDAITAHRNGQPLPDALRKSDARGFSASR